jgi:C-3',4' desaturase CrtD
VDESIVVVGGGVSGLTAAALLAHAGRHVTVVEGHTVPGGCASFYQRAGYRFDVGATLAGGFGARGVHRRIFAGLGVRLDAEPSPEPAMAVRIGDTEILRYGCAARWQDERRRAFGDAAEPFWLAQERIADLAWSFADGWPALPADLPGALALAGAVRPAHLGLAGTLGRTVADLYPAGASALLRTFVDAQLLITAQAPAEEADLAYGATALDLARDGTFHLPGGIAAIAIALARAVRRAGGTIRYGRRVTEIVLERGAARGVRLDDGTTLVAGAVVAALPVQNVVALLGARAASPALRALRARCAALPERWGAFTAYLGLPPRTVGAETILHQQLVRDPDLPLGEGNSVFVSFSPPDDRTRARDGGRAVTLSTHTDVARWERAAAAGTVAELTAAYGARLRAAFERVAPGAWAAARVVEFGTPFTFARYTGRWRGLCGGVPQTPEHANLRALSHVSGIPGLVLAGDTSFPGQSTVGASLSGIAAARSVFPRSVREISAAP